MEKRVSQCWLSIRAGYFKNSTSFDLILLKLCKTAVTKLRSSEMISMFSIDLGGNQSLHHLLGKAMWPPYCKQSLLQADSALSPSWWLGMCLTSRKVHSRQFHFSLSHPTVHGLQMHWGWRDAQYRAVNLSPLAEDSNWLPIPMSGDSQPVTPAPGRADASDLWAPAHTHTHTHPMCTQVKDKDKSFKKKSYFESESWNIANDNKWGSQKMCLGKLRSVCEKHNK